MCEREQNISAHSLFFSAIFIFLSPLLYLSQFSSLTDLAILSDVLWGSISAAPDPGNTEQHHAVSYVVAYFTGHPALPKSTADFLFPLKRTDTLLA